MEIAAVVGDARTLFRSINEVLSLLGLGLGAVVGLILALAGAGGGILAVPLLVFGLHLSIIQAAPVGLIAVGAASAFGAVLGLREGLVRYRAAALIGITGMVLAPVGVRLARLIPNAPLTVAFSIVLAWVAFRMFKHSSRKSHSMINSMRKTFMLQAVDTGERPHRAQGCRRSASRMNIAEPLVVASDCGEGA